MLPTLNGVCPMLCASVLAAGCGQLGFEAVFQGDAGLSSDSGVVDAAASLDSGVADAGLTLCAASLADRDSDGLADEFDRRPDSADELAFDDAFSDEAVWNRRGGDFAVVDEEARGSDGSLQRETLGFDPGVIRTHFSFADPGEDVWRVGFRLGYAMPFDLGCDIRFDGSRSDGEVLLTTTVETSVSAMMSSFATRLPACFEFSLQMEVGETETTCLLFAGKTLVAEGREPHNASFPAPAEDVRILAEGREVRFLSLRGWSR